jgi:large subunit ribosomal protein L7/L12
MPRLSPMSLFDIILIGVSANTVSVIRVVKDITGLGLKETKALVDSAPVTVKEQVSQREAEAAREKLEKAGATVELTRRT